MRTELSEAESKMLDAVIAVARERWQANKTGKAKFVTTTEDDCEIEIHFHPVE
jgi:hypothetical protein